MRELSGAYFSVPLLLRQRILCTRLCVPDSRHGMHHGSRNLTCPSHPANTKNNFEVKVKGKTQIRTKTHENRKIMTEQEKPQKKQETRINKKKKHLKDCEKDKKKHSSKQEFTQINQKHAGRENAVARSRCFTRLTKLSLQKMHNQNGENTK